jgi:peptidyl-prolyl cis-trans isomerase B (cyclophilin B)
MTDYTQVQELSPEVLADICVDIEVSVDGNDAGKITLEFWPNVAYETVRNFVRYAAEGFYNGKTFHRVIPGFMVQGGCPTGTGTGSGTYGNIPGEFNTDAKYTHARGVISMARSQNPNSASCQFFICHGAADFLDGQYASFGRMIEGDAALDALASVKTGGGGENSTPMAACKIESMKVYSRV